MISYRTVEQGTLFCGFSIEGLVERAGWFMTSPSGAQSHSHSRNYRSSPLSLPFCIAPRVDRSL